MAFSRKRLFGILTALAGSIGAALWLNSGGPPSSREPPLKYDRDIEAAHKNAGRKLAAGSFPWGTLEARKRDTPYVAGGINLSCDDGIREKCYALIAVYKPAASYAVPSLDDIQTVLDEEFGGREITGLGTYFALVNGHIPHRQPGDLTGFAVKDLPVGAVADYFDGRGKHMAMTRHPAGRARALVLECQYASRTPDTSLLVVPFWYEAALPDSAREAMENDDPGHPALTIEGPVEACPLRLAR